MLRLEKRLAQGGALLCPGLSHDAPLGRGKEEYLGTVRLHHRVMECISAISFNPGEPTSASGWAI